MSFNAGQRRSLAGGSGDDNQPAFDNFRDRPLFTRHSSQPTLLTGRSGDFIPPHQQPGGAHQMPGRSGISRSQIFTQQFEQCNDNYQGRRLVAGSNPGFSQWIDRDSFQGRQTVGRSGESFCQRPVSDSHQGRVSVAWTSGSFSQKSTQDGYQCRQTVAGSSQNFSQVQGFSQQPMKASCNQGQHRRVDSASQGFSQRENRDGRQGRQRESDLGQGCSQVSLANGISSFSQSQRTLPSNRCQGQQKPSRSGQAFGQSSVEPQSSVGQTFSQAAKKQKVGCQGQQKQQQPGSSQAFSQEQTQSSRYQGQHRSNTSQALSQQPGPSQKRLARDSYGPALDSNQDSVNKRPRFSQAATSGRTATPASAAMSAGHSQRLAAGNNCWSRYSQLPPAPAASLLQLGEVTVQDLWDFMVGRFQAVEAQQAHSLSAITTKLDQLMKQIAVANFAANSTQQSTVFEICDDQQGASRLSQSQPPQPTPTQRKSNLRVGRQSRTPTIRDALSELLDEPDDEDRRLNAQGPVASANNFAFDGESPSLFDISFEQVVGR